MHWFWGLGRILHSAKNLAKGATQPAAFLGQRRCVSKSHSVGWCHYLPGLESGAPCSKWPSIHPHRWLWRCGAPSRCQEVIWGKLEEQAAMPFSMSKCPIFEINLWFCVFLVCGSRTTYCHAVAAQSFTRCRSSGWNNWETSKRIWSVLMLCSQACLLISWIQCNMKSTEEQGRGN